MEEKASTVADETDVGSYFIANYPPFSVWTREAVSREARPALAEAPRKGVPLGLYLHIPFCRKRCHFCYFRVYTDKNAQQVAQYLDALVHEWELYQRQQALAGRPLSFVYFGGGTPSFLSARQLEHLVGGLSEKTPWSDAEEVTFECEPGTLTGSKLEVIRDLGVTRLSLGVENFDDGILERNGRAHRSAEVFRSYDVARKLHFPQVNVDLIAGMLGETDENWHACVRKLVELQPDSVTIYQMELPFNTTISADLLKGTGRFEAAADWSTKGRWVREAFEVLEGSGYHVGSAYTAVKDPNRSRFVYRDRLWEGADLAGLGVASFGHVNGVHLQNLDTWEAYVAALGRDELPLGRAYTPTGDERFVRELVLQLKRGWVEPAYFDAKHDVDVLERYGSTLAGLKDEGFLSSATRERVALSREGLLRVDTLLPRFFLPEHVGIRYT